MFSPNYLKHLRNLKITQIENRSAVLFDNRKGAFNFQDEIWTI
jgi:hypothetical protein